MRAFVLDRYGNGSVTSIQEVSKPIPKADEVLVEVHAVGLNPVDYKIREGKLKMIYSYPLPCVMGNELSGVVAACGSAVRDFKIGDRIFARVAKETLGAFAEFACVRESHLAKMPQHLDFTASAGIPLAALTALQAIRDELKIKSGYKILITGGAGGVGSFAIPIAKYFGAHVTTTASSRGQTLVRKLGADEVIDYTKIALDLGPKTFDGVLDLVGGETLLQSFARVKSEGRVVSIAGTPEPRTARQDLQRGLFLQALFWLASFSLRKTARQHRVDYRYLFMHPSGDDLRFLASMADNKALPVTLDRVFEFDQIGEAFSYLEDGHAKGKIVIRIKPAVV